MTRLIVYPPHTYPRGSQVELRGWFGVEPRRLAREAPVGATTITLAAPPPAAWVPGVVLLLSPGDDEAIEQAAIQSVAGRTITLTAPLALPHQIEPATSPDYRGRDLVARLASPTNPLIEVLPPGATTATAYTGGQLTTATGWASVTIDLPTVGEWAWRVSATTGVTAAGWRRLIVPPDPFA